MHRSFEWSTTPSSVEKMQLTGQTAAQGASVQCMQAMETERSPGLPSLMVTTRLRLMPHGTSFSFLQAVTQALHSMQRSASQRNFIRAMVTFSRRPDLAERGLRFLHTGCRIVAIGVERVHALAEHDRIGTFRIFAALVDALVPAGKMVGHPNDALADAGGDQRVHFRLRVVFGAEDPDPGAVLDAALGRIRRIDFDEHVLLELGEPLVGARLLAATLIVDQPAGGQTQR